MNFIDEDCENRPKTFSFGKSIFNVTTPTSP